MPKKKIRFIVNPISGIGKQKIVPDLISRHLDHDIFEFDIAYTEYAKHATEIAKNATENQYDIVAIVGGDGSVNEVGKILVNTNTALAIIPTGSGNGLARHLNIPLNIEDAIRTINHNCSKKIDTGTVNDHFFAGVCGVGFDALIAWRFAEFGKRGFISYVKIIMKEYMRYNCDEYIIKANNQESKQRAFLVTAANSSQYGNRVTIAPDAKIDDGIFELCILNKLPWYALPFIAYRFFNKRINKSKYLTTIKGSEFEIQLKNNLAHVDGEPIKIENNCKIKILPTSLNVIIPK